MGNGENFILTYSHVIAISFSKHILLHFHFQAARSDQGSDQGPKSPLTEELDKPHLIKKGEIFSVAKTAI